MPARARRRPGVRMRLVVGPLVGLLLGLLVGLPVALPASAADIDCSTLDATAPLTRATTPSRPAELMGVRQAQALAASGGLAGDGQTVAVVDSGVADSEVLPEVLHVGEAPLQDYHGTAVAGLVAGRPLGDGDVVGMAPGARIVDVRVYDQSPVRSEGARGVTAAAVADGLAWVAAHWRRERIGVAVVGLAVPADPRLARVVRRLGTRTDVLLVAASGNRPAEGDPLLAALPDPRPGEDAADLVFPAGYPGVLAVSATAEGADEVDARDWVLPSSAIDVAAPTYGAVTAGLGGGTCVLSQIATSWAAAEVAGLAALLRQRFPDENAAQIAARLVDTADGSPREPTRMAGAGRVQPVEALTRPLAPAPDGTLARDQEVPDTTPPARAPAPIRSVLPDVRHSARWFALGGGALVLLAVILRPLARRRGAPATSRRHGSAGASRPTRR